MCGLRGGLRYSGGRPDTLGLPGLSAERLKRERTSNAYISTCSSLYAMSVNRMTLRSLHYSTILRSAALCRCTLASRRAPRDATMWTRTPRRATSGSGRVHGCNFACIWSSGHVLVGRCACARAEGLAPRCSPSRLIVTRLSPPCALCRARLHFVLALSL